MKTDLEQRAKKKEGKKKRAPPGVALILSFLLKDLAIKKQ